MKEIIRQYGMILLAMFVGGVIISMFHWLMPMIIQPVSREGSVSLQDDFPGMSHQEVWANYGITGEFEGEISCGETVAVEEHISCQNKAGEALAILKKIVDREGNSVPWTTLDGKEYFKFEKEGIYTVYFSVEDANGVVQYEKVRIPVQRKTV